jgi:protein SERAC1
MGVALVKPLTEIAQATPPPEILTDYEIFTTVAPDDRRTLAEKLIAGDRAIEIADAERKKDRFAKTLRRNASQASSVMRYTRIMAEVESRFKRHVRPLIVQNKDEGTVNAAVQAQVINPIFEAQAKETDDVTTAVIDCALYYLTGNCHVRWDHHED